MGRNIAIPKFLEHLPVFAGMPVGYLVKWKENKPDFRDVDLDKWMKVVNEDLCGICGRKLGHYKFFIGGPKSVENHIFMDPPMHRGCAEYSMVVCPFLFGERDHYRFDEGEKPIHPLMDVEGGRPRRLAVIRVEKFSPTVMSHKVVLLAEKYFGVKWYEKKEESKCPVAHG